MHDIFSLLVQIVFNVRPNAAIMRPFKRGLVCGKVSESEPQTKPRLNGSLFIVLLEVTALVLDLG